MNSRRLPLVFLLLAFFSLVIGLILGLVVDPMLFARMGSVVVLGTLVWGFGDLVL